MTFLYFTATRKGECKCKQSFRLHFNSIKKKDRRKWREKKHAFPVMDTHTIQPKIVCDVFFCCGEISSRLNVCMKLQSIIPRACLVCTFCYSSMVPLEQKGKKWLHQFCLHSCAYTRAMFNGLRPSVAFICVKESSQAIYRHDWFDYDSEELKCKRKKNNEAIHAL